MVEGVVGQLKVTEPRLIRAIQNLGGLIATLNYDSLLAQVTGRPPIHWRQQTEITRYLRGHSNEFILHLHGQWEVPESIVLDHNSYEAIAGDVKTQDLLRRFARFETMLFIGCGQTFFDPSFQTLLRWANDALGWLNTGHSALCRRCEEPNMLAELRSHAYLAPLVYGEAYEDLAPFLLKTLGSESGSAAAVNPLITSQVGFGTMGPSKLVKPADVWKLQSGR